MGHHSGACECECGCGGMCEREMTKEKKMEHLEKKEARLVEMLAHVREVKDRISKGDQKADMHD